MANSDEQTLEDVRKKSITPTKNKFQHNAPNELEQNSHQSTSLTFGFHCKLVVVAAGSWIGCLTENPWSATEIEWCSQRRSGRLSSFLRVELSGEERGRGRKIKSQ